MPHHIQLLSLYIVIIVNQPFSVNSHFYVLSDGQAVCFVGLLPQEIVICLLLGPVSPAFTAVFPAPRIRPHLFGLWWLNIVKYVSVPTSLLPPSCSQISFLLCLGKGCRDNMVRDQSQLTGLIILDKYSGLK